MYTTVTLQDLLNKGVTYYNIAGVWQDSDGACYSLKDKTALDEVECEELRGDISEYLTAKEVKDEMCRRL